MAERDFQNIQLFFEEATALEGVARELFLRDLRDACPELANDLGSLLDHTERDEDPLEATCAFIDRQVDASDDRNEATEFLPVIPGYEVECKIGTGGQANVYRAFQESTGQAVAVKVFRGLSLTEAQRHRIDAETEALARLQIPNVVPILDRGQLGGGQEYLITRYVDGLPIDQAARRLLPDYPDKFVALFLRVAETLSQVHQEGILHRDLKPSNILVDHNDQPFLLDFGLARFFADPSGRLLTATPSDGFQGTILWSSPEQLDTSYGDIDRRSDLYSLGVIIYQSATDRFPYAIDGGILGVAQQIVQSRPASFKQSDPLTGVLASPEFSKIIFRALEKPQRRRFQSAEELATALRVLQREGEGVHSAFARPQRPKRNTLVIGSGLVACAAALLLIAPVLFPPQSDDWEPDKPVADKDLREIIPVFNDQLAGFGTVPDGWTQVGEMQDNHHEIGRSVPPISGDFSLKITLSAAREKRCSVGLTLIGTDGSIDVRVAGEKTNTWSSNEEWVFQFPTELVRKSLPIQQHTFLLRREGALLSLTVEAATDEAGPLVGQFMTKDFGALTEVRLATSGPQLHVGQVVLVTGE